MMRLSARQGAVIAGTIGIGLAAGLGVFTFGYAKGASYLTNDPAACANCHVMSEHFSAWEKGSHRAVATCNDCHTPHNFVGKYTTKALNGFWHSFYFTTGQYPDPLRITERNRNVTEQACRYCHAPIVDAIDQPVASRKDLHGNGRSIHAGAAPALISTAGPAPRHAAVTAAGLGAMQSPSTLGAGNAHADAQMSCIRCHTYVGHWVR